MGDPTTGTTQNFSNTELEVAYQEANTGKVGRASAKLSFEVELALCANTKANIMLHTLHQQGFITRLVMDPCFKIYLEDTLVAFYKEAEKLKNAQRI